MANTDDLKRIWVARTLAGNPFSERSQERSVMLASYLADRGYKVTYWGTAFDHVHKKFLWNETIHEKVNENEDAVMLHPKIGYRKNISLKRFFYGKAMARELKNEINKKGDFTPPDIIFSAWPQEEICRVLEDYGKVNKVPVIVDVRDMWPDIFEYAFPKALRRMAPMILSPLKKRAAKTFRHADAICSMSPVALKWGLKYAGREKSFLDRVVYLGKERKILNEEEVQKQFKEMTAKRVTPDTWNLCVFTTLSSRGLDLDTVIKAVEIVHGTHPEIRLVIGGTGDDEGRLRNLISKFPYIVMPGYMNDAQMTYMMSISKAGLLPYRNCSDMKNAWGNKVGQYFSAGLPFFNSTEGIANRYIKKYGCGINYQEGNSKELAEKIIALMKNPRELKVMSENARERFEEDFEANKIMRKLEEMLHEVYRRYRSGL